MKTKMYIAAPFLFLCFLFSTNVFGGNNNLGNPRAIMAEVGKPGTVVIKVWSYNKTAKISDEIVIENAIKCILFDGIEPDESRHMNGRPALVSDSYNDNASYYDAFFANKEYLQYCTMAMEGYVEQGNLLKLKKGYKIGKIVVVKYDQLRKRLVQDGVIKGLDSGF